MKLILISVDKHECFDVEVGLELSISGKLFTIKEVLEDGLLLSSHGEEGVFVQRSSLKKVLDVFAFYDSEESCQKQLQNWGEDPVGGVQLLVDSYLEETRQDDRESRKDLLSKVQGLLKLFK